MRRPLSRLLRQGSYEPGAVPGGTQDARRDAALGRLGYRVVRVSAELAMRELGEAVRVLGAWLRS